MKLETTCHDAASEADADPSMCETSSPTCTDDDVLAAGRGCLNALSADDLESCIRAWATTVDPAVVID
jgi:hypothetical protein